MECDSCSGLFVPHETFEMMQDASERVILSTQRAQAGRLEIEKTISYVKCPVCRTLMNRKNFAGMSGVIVDICGYHGVWFDAGELGKIMDFVAKGGLLKAREKEQQEKLREYEQQMRLRTNEALMSGSNIHSGMFDPVSHVGGLALLEILADVIDVFKE
jgi:Zn-finger nucleic acid-binding protein